jgi:hypothetical protein
MNVRLLKIGVVCQNPRRRLILSLTTLLLLTLCINNARATAVTWTHDAGGFCSEASNWFPNQAPACGDKAIVSNSGANTVTDHFATPRNNDLFCHHRRRTGSPFDTHFQNDFTVAQNGCLPLKASGIIVAEDEAAPPVIFFSTTTARGPPWSGEQSQYLSDNTLGRLAPHFSTAPLLSKFRFLHCPSFLNTTGLFIQSSLVSRADASLVAAISQSNTTNPFNSRNHYEIQMQFNAAGHAAG